MEQIFKFFPNRSKKSVKCQWRRLNSTWNKILAEFKSKDRENYERLQELQQDIEISEESIDMSKVEFVDLEAGKETHEDNNDLPNQHLIEEDKQGEEGKQEDGGNQDNNDFPNQHLVEEEGNQDNDLPNQHLVEKDKQGEEGKQEDGGNQEEDKRSNDKIIIDLVEDECNNKQQNNVPVEHNNEESIDITSDEPIIYDDLSRYLDESVTNNSKITNDSRSLISTPNDEIVKNSNLKLDNMNVFKLKVIQSFLSNLMEQNKLDLNRAGQDLSNNNKETKRTNKRTKPTAKTANSSKPTEERKAPMNQNQFKNKSKPQTIEQRKDKNDNYLLSSISNYLAGNNNKDNKEKKHKENKVTNKDDKPIKKREAKKKNKDFSE